MTIELEFPQGHVLAEVEIRGPFAPYSDEWGDFGPPEYEIEVVSLELPPGVTRQDVMGEIMERALDACD